MTGVHHRFFQFPNFCIVFLSYSGIKGIKSFFDKSYSLSHAFAGFERQIKVDKKVKGNGQLNLYLKKDHFTGQAPIGLSVPGPGISSRTGIDSLQRAHLLAF